MKYLQSASGEYQIEKTLERSQYSVLCQGKKSDSEQPVLLKLWLTAQVTSAREQERVREEVAALRSLSHPHLLPLVEVLVDEQKICLVSEDAPAGSLREWLEKESAATIILEDRLQILDQIGQALQFLHTNGFVHGNLTPQAVFLSAPGQVKLGDMRLESILNSIHDYQRTLDENVPRCFYMAPEQFRGWLNTKTDQYALGCLAYVLLAGQAPFTGSARATLSQKHQRDQPPALRALNPAVPAHVEKAVLKALAKNPRKRYISVQAFLDALDVPGKRMMADQSTVKHQAYSAPSGATKPDSLWEWDTAAQSEEPQAEAGALTLPDAQIQYPLPVRFPPSKLPASRPARSRAKRLRYALIPGILLLLALLFIASKWLFFPGVFNAPASNQKANRSTSTAVSQPTTTPTALPTLTPTPTFTPTPTPTAKPSPTARTTPTTPPTPAQTLVALSAFFNNEGIGNAPGQADFDGSGYSYPGSQLPAGGQVRINGVSYQFPGHAPGAKDNISASGQTIALTPGKYRQVSLLVSASWGPMSGTFTMRYADGSTATASITVLDWYQTTANGLSTSERYSASGIDHNPVSIFVITITLNATRTASALILPGPQSGPHSNGHIHVFALTLLH